MPIFIRTGQKSWINRHETFNQDVEDFFDVYNPETDDVLNDYNAMTQAIQIELGARINQNRTARVLGGGWSWPKIATTSGIMYNSKRQNLVMSISAQSLDINYMGISVGKKPIFAQCGNSIFELNKFLESRGLSLPTSGASNGQTIVGALSTGTHGAAFDFGAIPEFVAGLHIVVGKNHHIYLERASYPVMKPSFADKIGAKFMKDDDLFNAALVSMGSFGWIHGVVIESVPKYLLESYRFQKPLDAKLETLMTTLDFQNYRELPLGNDVRPWHFQVVINPYDYKKQAYLTIMYKIPNRSNYPKPPGLSSGIGVGDDAPKFIGTITDILPTIIPFTVNNLVKISYPPLNKVIGTHGETFSNTDLRGKVLSAAIGIPIDKVIEVKNLLMKINEDEGPFAVIFAFRYVKATKATLGFTRFSPVTCVVELDGVFSGRTKAFYQKVWNTLEAAGIPFTFHWGKDSIINPKRLRQMYGTALDKWFEARHKLLDDDMIHLFNNEQMKEWGLDES